MLKYGPCNRQLSVLVLLAGAAISLPAQTSQPVTPATTPPVAKEPTPGDLLRGAYGPFRANNDLLYYHLDIRVDPDKKIISGKNTIRFRMLKDGTRIQLDLSEKLHIDKILLWARPRSSTSATRGAVFIDFPETLRTGHSLLDRLLLLRQSARDGPLRLLHLQERRLRPRLDQHRLRRRRRQHLVAEQGSVARRVRKAWTSASPSPTA